MGGLDYWQQWKGALWREAFWKMLILLVWINICCNYEGDGATNGLAVFRNTFVTKPVFFYFNSKFQSWLVWFFLHSYRISPSWECWDTCWFQPNLVTKSTIDVLKDNLVTVFGPGMLPARLHSRRCVTAT